MTTLIAIPRLPEAEEDGAHTELPELPALTRLLLRARRLPDSPDWQAGVMQALGMEAIPAVALAAAALPGLPQGSGICFAAPLHVVAGISRVHLPPGGELLLDAAEEAAWRAAFNTEFAAAGAALHAAPGGGWLLAASCAEGARDMAPELLSGGTLERSPATGDVQRALRRLGTEVEMWLASHPLNRQRERRGGPVLNTIWLWGGARSIALPRPQALRGIVTGQAGNAWLAGLAAWAQTTQVHAANWVEAMQSAPALLSSQAPASGQALIVPAAQGVQSTAQYWQGLEEHWFAPAARALAAGDNAPLQVQLGGAAWQVQRRSMRHWLRWRRHRWWQMGRHR